MGEPQAYREMTPDEIRLDEVRRTIGWIEGWADPWSRGPVNTEDVLKGLRYRAGTLEPPAIAAEEPAVYTAIEGLNQTIKDLEGLRYQQDVKSSIRVYPEQPHVVGGSKLDVRVSIPFSSPQFAFYDIPPYQVDQLQAIADGRASWPDVKPPFSTEQLVELAQPIKAIGEDPIEDVIWHGLELLKLDESVEGARKLPADTWASLNRTVAWAIVTYLQRQLENEQKERRTE